MPVLDPSPQHSQRKLLYVFGAIFGILVIIGVVASLAS
ncbi:SGM_5486 family transporter-associated protein [Streptomyces montanisoli]|nr:SGM_5486 family transporter-associated protein [Streptomyces montanisoli]